MKNIENIENMKYINKYNSPLGEITLLINENRITGLWFVDQKYYPKDLEKEYKEKETDLTKKVKEWLDKYFEGENPDFEIPIDLKGTEFQKEVWKILCTIPYGTTITYGDISKIYSKEKGIKSMSAQAIGSAVGRNRISIIVPCHRVIGKDGSLTGYAGGIEKKEVLLNLEKNLKFRI